MGAGMARMPDEISPGMACLVCAMSGDVMDEHNPPMLLPNGSVYSTNALQVGGGFARVRVIIDLAQAQAAADGAVTCLLSKQRFALAQCRTLYVI